MSTQKNTPQHSHDNDLNVQGTEKSLDPCPIADDWLNDEQLAQVRSRVRQCIGGAVAIATHSDIFSAFDIEAMPQSSGEQ